MAPSGDMPTIAAKTDSFTLANVVPQDQDMNGKLWNDVEQATRQLAKRRTVRASPQGTEGQTVVEDTRRPHAHRSTHA